MRDVVSFSRQVGPAIDLRHPVKGFALCQNRAVELRKGGGSDVPCRRKSTPGRSAAATARIVNSTSAAMATATDTRAFEKPRRQRRGARVRPPMPEAFAADGSPPLLRALKRACRRGRAGPQGMNRTWRFMEKMCDQGTVQGRTHTLRQEAIDAGRASPYGPTIAEFSP